MTEPTKTKAALLADIRAAARTLTTAEREIRERFGGRGRDKALQHEIADAHSEGHVAGAPVRSSSPVAPPPSPEGRNRPDPTAWATPLVMNLWFLHDDAVVAGRAAYEVERAIAEVEASAASIRREFSDTQDIEAQIADAITAGTAQGRAWAAEDAVDEGDAPR